MPLYGLVIGPFMSSQQSTVKENVRLFVIAFIKKVKLATIFFGLTDAFFPVARCNVFM
jgi:hypothetical protein